MWINLKKPILALAPLADITDRPFCRTLREFAPPLTRVSAGQGGGDFVIFREMASAEGLVRENKKTLRMCGFDEIERPIVQQIFGADPLSMAKAAEIVMEKFHPDGIDINMGCPVPKIAQKTEAGAALMKNHAKAAEIVRALKAAGLGVPVSVKTRLGWSDPGEILEFAPRLEEAGADLISIHGRTKAQGYAGEADWQAIGEAKKRVSIPVLANGDINSPEDAKHCLEITGADGLMIGRGAIANPWIFQQIRYSEAEPPNIEKQIEFILRHAEAHVDYYGERGILAFRKYFSYYLKGEPGVKDWRSKLTRIKSISDLKNILEVMIGEKIDE